MKAWSWFKAAVFALLALNTGIFLRSGTFSEGLDSIAWLTLLALFELETGWGKLGRTPFLANTHSVLRDQKEGPEKVCVPISVTDRRLRPQAAPAAQLHLDSGSR
jgi:hypothetical protein